jgi:hypothetical protein
MLETMGDPPVSVRPPVGPPAKTPWRYTRLGSVLLSVDFYLGVPAGIALGLLPALSKPASGMATTLLIALGAAAVAVAAVVVAAKTIFVSLVTPEYMVVLERARGGVKGAARPFVIVAWVCTAAALLNFAAALAWPAIPEHAWWLRWLVFAIPAALAGWGLLGSAQLVSLGAFHLEQRSILMKAIRDFRQRSDKSSRSA